MITEYMICHDEYLYGKYIGWDNADYFKDLSAQAKKIFIQLVNLSESV